MHQVIRQPHRKMNQKNLPERESLKKNIYGMLSN